MKHWITGMLLAASLPAAALDLATLTRGQAVHGFTCQALYEDGQGRVMGTRLQAENGFVLDLLTIESVPQAFWWIRTAPGDSRGEPHACEHLLLGKGRRGRAVAALEDMRLATSTAYTDQLHTCYQFHTTAGLPTFLELFEAKLRALLQPDFLDEEIRREVCHYDVAQDESGRLSLEEKGTVYTEMVSSFEKPWYWGSEAMARLVYGADHPLYHNAGGDPRVMWRWSPKTCGASTATAISRPTWAPSSACPPPPTSSPPWRRWAAILQRCDTPAPRPVPAGIGAEPLPAPRPAPAGTVEWVTYPSPRPEDPASLSLQWPADLELTAPDAHLLELFLAAFAGGETSTLYAKLVDSVTPGTGPGCRVGVGLPEPEPGAFRGPGPGGAAFRRAGRRRRGACPHGGPRQPGGAGRPGARDSLLEDFNRRVAAIAQGNRRWLRDYLGSPPMFGHRSGNAGAWLELLKDCEGDPGFRKSLVRAGEVQAVDSLLALPGNPWTAAIQRWRLLERPPFVVVSTPSPERQQQVLDQAAQRRQDFLAGVMSRLGLSDEQAALAAYRDEFSARTAALEAASADDPLPGFLPDPAPGPG